MNNWVVLSTIGYAIVLYLHGSELHDLKRDVLIDNEIFQARERADHSNIEKLSQDLRKLALVVKKLQDENVYINEVVSGH